MLTRARTAMKFFTYGLLLGILFAPGSGEETRSRIKDMILQRGG